MRSVIKRRREAGDHRSSTPRLGSQPSRSVLSRRRRNPSVVGLPSYGFIRSPSAFVAAVPSLRSKLRSVTLATRSRRRPRPSLSGLLWLANSEVSGACCRTPPAPRLWGSLPRLLFLLHAIPPRFFVKYEKGETSPPPLGGSKCHSSNPCTTVSSVDDSNARAASVTGRYANRTATVCPSSP